VEKEVNYPDMMMTLYYNLYESPISDVRNNTLTKKLYITEKPSVADSFASVLGVEISKSDRGRGFAESENAIIS